MEQYFDRFGGVRDYLRDVVDQARKDGYTSTVFGRRRYLPELDSSNRNVREAAERAALNAPIQGSAADIIKVAMINVDTALKDAGLKSRMLLQVHDELLFEVADGERDALEKLVRDKMGNAYPLDVPLEVSVGYGRSWDTRRALVSAHRRQGQRPNAISAAPITAFDAATNVDSAQHFSGPSRCQDHAGTPRGVDERAEWLPAREGSAAPGRWTAGTAAATTIPNAAAFGLAAMDSSAARNAAAGVLPRGGSRQLDRLPGRLAFRHALTPSQIRIAAPTTCNAIDSARLAINSTDSPAPPASVQRRSLSHCRRRPPTPPRGRREPSGAETTLSPARAARRESRTRSETRA